MLDLAKRFYELCPAFIKASVRRAPASILYGRSYTATVPSIDPRLEKINLYRTLVYAREHTRFWENKIPPMFGLDETFSVYESLPEIDSELVSEEPDLFVGKGFGRKNSYWTTTGGTGRASTAILLSNDSFGCEWRHIDELWGSSGYVRQSDAKVTLRGKRTKGESIIDYNPLYNEYVVDTFRLSERNVHQLLDVIDHNHVRYLHGYPSLAKEFMQLCESERTKPIFKALLLGSEGCSDKERDELASFFRANVVTWYGQTEKVALAYDTDGEGSLVNFSSYGFVDTSGSGFGELRGTTFVNKAMPLIKYRTGDYGEVEVTGSGRVIHRLVGRWGKDYVYLSQQKRVPTSSVNLHSTVQKEILFLQFEQRKFGELEVKVVPRGAREEVGDRLVARVDMELRDRLPGFQVVCRLARPQDVIRSGRGKMKMLVQHLPIDT